MVYRGCVVKIEESFAIVLTTHAEYLKVEKKEGLTTGKEILFIEEDLYHEKSSGFKSFGLVAAVVMMLFLSVTLWNGLQQWLPLQQVAAIVSIDINPSLELEVNRENKVLRGVAVNEEGKLLADPSLKGLVLEDAVLQVVDKAKSLEYITPDKKAILISTVVLKDETNLSPYQLEEAILNKLEEKEIFKEIQLIYVRSKKEDIQKAREEKISIGKYEVFLKALEEKQKVTLEEIKKAKVQELVEKEVGKFKIKEAEKKKPENDKKQEKENEKQIKKDSSKDKNNDKDKSLEQTDSKEKKNPMPKNKEDKEILEKPVEKNKLSAGKENLQKKEIQKIHQKNKTDESSNNGKQDEKKQKEYSIQRKNMKNKSQN